MAWSDAARAAAALVRQARRGAYKKDPAMMMALYKQQRLTGASRRVSLNTAGHQVFKTSMAGKTNAFRSFRRGKR